jgi:hypothetical protein
MTVTQQQRVNVLFRRKLMIKNLLLKVMDTTKDIEKEHLKYVVSLNRSSMNRDYKL